MAVGKGMKIFVGITAVTGISVLSWTALNQPAQQAAAPGSTAKQFSQAAVSQTIYGGDLRDGWQDWGWSQRDLGSDRPAQVNFSSYGGWILGHSKVQTATEFSAVRLRVKQPSHFGDFLELQLLRKDRQDLTPVVIRPRHRVQEKGGWYTATVPMAELNPRRALFDVVQIRAVSSVGTQWVLLDDIVLLAGSGESIAGVAVASNLPEVESYIECASLGHAIDPMIYGIGYSPRLASQHKYIFELNPGSRRWGGNHTSRYNWRLGNAWNTAADWYFRNVDYTDNPGFSWRDFLIENRDRQIATALTIPLIGWVAKDRTSYSFPVTVFGRQAGAEPDRPDVGNGVGLDGENLKPGPATRTSIKMPPSEAGKWVAQIRKLDQENGKRHVQIYFLDNEPMLWDSTHRDVHPEPVSYDELLERSVDFATAIRENDPQGVIAGPALWGWLAYEFSAKDAVGGFHLKPDRRAHGDVPLLAWYLQKLRAHEQKTGIKLLDMVDVHYYPQSKDVHGGAGGHGGTDAETSALRIRSTRSLWDPSYTDESWIDEKIALLPRLKKLVDNNYPGLGICIGEYNFGAEQHMSGAIALAEVLGRFGQFKGLSAAYYWTYPPAGSPTYYAFRAFRDYDHKGSTFGDYSLPSKSGEGFSLFASSDRSGKNIVAVAVNKEPDRSVLANIQLKSCPLPQMGKVYRYSEASADIVLVDAKTITLKKGVLRAPLPAYSITILEMSCRP